MQPAPRKGKHLSRTSTCKLEHAPEPSCTRESPPSRRRDGSGKDSQAGGPDVGTAQVRHRDDDDDIHQSSRRARTQTRVLLLVAPPARLGAGYKCDDGGGRRECVRPSCRGGGTDRPTGWRCATALGGLRPLVVMSVAIREVVMMVVVMMMRRVVMRVGQTSYLPTQGSTTSSPSEVAGRKGTGGKLPFRYEHARARAPAATTTGAVMLPLDAWLMSRKGGERFRSGEAQRGADGPTCLITDPGFQCRQPNAAQARCSPFRRDGRCLFQARRD